MASTIMTLANCNAAMTGHPGHQQGIHVDKCMRASHAAQAGLFISPECWKRIQREVKGVKKGDLKFIPKGKPMSIFIFLETVVPLKRLELPTPSLRMTCSTS
jgi:hypothetical protein